MIQTTPPPAAVEGAPVKPGKTSTEFAGKTVAQLIVMGLAVAGIAIDIETAAMIVAGLEALYMVIRGHVKAASYKTVTVIEKESKS